MKSPKKLLASGVLAWGLVTVAVPAGHVHASTPATTNPTMDAAQEGDSASWGWIGLLGLLGLTGLMGRKRNDPAVADRNAAERDARRL